MRINKFLGKVSPLTIVLGFDTEGAASGGDAAPATTPSLMGNTTEGQSDDGSNEGSDGAGDAGVSGDAGASDTGGNDETGGQKPDGASDGAAVSEASEGAEDAAEGDQADGEASGAPETYDFSSVFEGEDAPQLSEAILEEFTGILREDNLSQEKANRYMQVAKKLQDHWLSEITQHHVDQRADWRAQAQNHPEFGGDKFNENLALAKQARDAFGSEALGTLLDESGLGDHPEVISFFYRVGKANSEHGFVKSGIAAPSKSFYDHPTSKGRRK